MANIKTRLRIKRYSLAQKKQMTFDASKIASIVSSLSSQGISVAPIVDQVGKLILQLQESDRQHIQTIVACFSTALRGEGYSRITYKESSTSSAISGTAIGTTVGGGLGAAIGGGVGLITGTVLFLCPLTTPIGLLVAAGSGAAMATGGVVAATSTITGLIIGNSKKKTTLTIEYSK